MSRLIIIRGNSGSGKSTVAKRLRREMGYGTTLVQQDVVRREILRVQDKPGNPAIQLIADIALYAHSIGDNVVIEGIMPADRYGDMLHSVAGQFGETFVYYFDIPFEETLRRHNTKLNAHEFGEKEMREWWCERDVLGEDDRIITSDMSEDEIITKIMKDITEDENKLPHNQQTKI